MRLTSSQIRNCIQACINSYDGEHGRVRPIFNNPGYFDIDHVEGHYGIIDETLYIIFRGSDGRGDWRDNFKFWQKEIPYDGTNPKIRVHAGFIKQYKKIRNEIHDIISINSLVRRTIITGHSLGGALATLCALDIQYNFPERDIICIPFGSPRVGNYYFVKSYNKRVKNTHRYVNGDDLVCKVPLAIFGYVHIATKIKIGKRKWWGFMLGSIQDHYPMNYQGALAVKYW